MSGLEWTPDVSIYRQRWRENTGACLQAPAGEGITMTETEPTARDVEDEPEWDSEDSNRYHDLKDLEDLAAALDAIPHLRDDIKLLLAVCDLYAPHLAGTGEFLADIRVPVARVRAAVTWKGSR